MDGTNSRSVVVTTAPGLVESARSHHRAGRLPLAASFYKEAIAADPDDAEALHLLGVLRHQQGALQEADDLIARAANLVPGHGLIRLNQAEVALALNRFEDAARHARAAVAQGADGPETRHVLGRALLALGQHAAAVPELLRATRLRPAFLAALLDLGDALLALGRLDESARAYESAIQAAPRNAAPHARLAVVHLREHRVESAGQALVDATELAPDHAPYWEMLADVYASVEQFAAAVRCWETVLRLTPDDRARPHLALGSALRDEARLPEAEAHFLAAAAIEPGTAAPRLELGNLHEVQGRFREAEALYREAVRLEPTNGHAHARLANLLKAKLPPDDLLALLARLDDPETPDAARARLLYAHVQVLDAQGLHEQAAARSREANALHEAGAEGLRKFRPDAFESFVAALTAAFTPAFFARMAGAGLESRRPVFVIGLPRSGTTLIEQVLASHPSVFGAGELPLGRLLFENLPALIDDPSAGLLDCIPRLDRDALRRLAVAYETRLVKIARGQEADRVVDKMLDNAMYLGLLTVLFPRAAVIHCRRNLRDVALSCWLTDFRSVAWAANPDHLGIKFRAHLKLMEHWNATLPTPIHEVAYEDTVSDLEGVARRLIDALGLPWHPGCLDFHRSPRTVRTASVTQVRQPLYSRSVGRWERYASFLPDLFAAIPSES